MKERSALPADRASAPGLISRLRSNTAGNTLMLVAGAIIPLTAMIGAGVDMGRTYLVKSRLQQACDAGVLAGRKYMTGTTLDDVAAGRATAFFSNNFPSGSFGTTNVSFTPSRTNDGQVTGTATARVPMAVMQIFGNTQVDLNVVCDARLEIANTDVMLVLDVTGSMADCPDDSNCGSGPGSKIVGLRSAVMSFYDTISAATSANARLRVGFVPYSSAVNIGIDPFTNTPILQSGWLVDNWTYQSRVANMTKDGWSPTTTYSSWTDQTYGTAINNSSCTKYGNNTPFTGFSPNPSGNPTVPTNDVFQEGQPATVVQTIYRRLTPSYSGSKSCTRQYRTATTSYAQNGRYGFTNWSYMPVTYNAGNYKAGTVVTAFTGNYAPTGTVTTEGSYNMVDLVNTAGSTVTGTSTTFDGCIEERETIAQTSFAAIPSGAYDLDVNTVPSSDATRWRPMWNELIYDRSAGGGFNEELNVTTNRSPTNSYACPTEASKLAVRTRADMQDYVNGLVATGYTFHDLGMAWGVRLLSPNGLFASENTTAPNGRPISRHIIFMTDGMMNTPPSVYTSHGYEESDRRVSGLAVSPTTSDLINRHNARFQALCNQARANNITVWTIAFGTSNPPTLVSCADSGKSFVATDTAALTAQFQQIAANIAKLRLSR
jgi:Flp pilus assembly protein TadG